MLQNWASNGNGKTIVSIHDAPLDPFSGELTILIFVAFTNLILIYYVL